jgi:NAD(P)H-dependent FMN reductase
MSEKVHVGVIYGSTRTGRFCDIVVKWTVERIDAYGKFEVDVIDPILVSAEDVAQRPGFLSLQEKLGAAEAFVVVTPEYNHGYPAPLKALIDSTGAEWYAKPVAFVSYGGISGGLRAVEQLRLVFAELHAVSIRDSVSFASAWEQFGPDGTLRDPNRAHKSMEVLLERLHWWALALRNARATSPYLQSA